MIKRLLFISALLVSFLSKSQTYIMSNSPISTCSGTHMDPGGPGDYADNSNFTQTISPFGGNCVVLTFTSFATESGYDFLTIYDGTNTAAPQVPGSPFSGTTNPGTITSTSGSLTLVFTSDFSNFDAGWSATIACGSCPPPPPPPNSTYAWTQRASNPGPARHRAVALTVGNRGYAGLGHINAVTDILYQDWWEYDPGTDSWTQKANFPPGPRMHACGFSIGNFAYVGTGRDNSFTEQPDFYKYDPSTNTWTTLSSMPTAGRRGAVAFAINGKGYVGTGSYGSDFWEYNPVGNSWTQKAFFPGAGRSSAAGFAIGSKGYLGTGDTGGPNADFYEYNPVTDIWIMKAPVPLARMEAAGFAMQGSGFIGTGCDFQSGTNYSDFWQYDPAANNWGQISDFSGAARRYMATFVIGARAYGVYGTSGTNYNDLWEYGNFSGIDEQNKNSVSVKTFPNPFEEKITFSIPAEIKIETATLSIYDVYGKIIQKIENIKAHDVVIEKGAMAKGVYYYELLLNKKRTTGKIISL